MIIIIIIIGPGFDFRRVFAISAKLFGGSTAGTRFGVHAAPSVVRVRVGVFSAGRSRARPGDAAGAEYITGRQRQTRDDKPARFILNVTLLSAARGSDGRTTARPPHMKIEENIVILFVNARSDRRAVELPVRIPLQFDNAICFSHSYIVSREYTGVVRTERGRLAYGKAQARRFALNASLAESCAPSRSRSTCVPSVRRLAREALALGSYSSAAA